MYTDWLIGQRERNICTRSSLSRILVFFFLTCSFLFFSAPFMDYYNTYVQGFSCICVLEELSVGCTRTQGRSVSYVIEERENRAVKNDSSVDVGLLSK